MLMSISYSDTSRYDSLFPDSALYSNKIALFLNLTYHSHSLYDSSYIGYSTTVEYSRLIWLNSSQGV